MKYTAMIMFAARAVRINIRTFFVFFPRDGSFTIEFTEVVPIAIV